MSPFEISMTENELNLITNHYIKDIVIDGYPHYLLIMDEYDIIEVYNKDKYCILEVLQDIDGFNKDSDIYTNYYLEYKTHFYTQL
tara:strand:- start:5817 stop:6071 length:255 start_codon:yes stop_codon:yes gene_type:complete